jgi:receptor expression-enhancing protein 5/6
VPKVYAVLGVASLYFFFVFFNIYGEFLVNLAAFVGPGYYTLDTLFTANRANETVIQWLTVRVLRLEQAS